MNETKIVKNSARCNKCGDVLVSHFETQKSERMNVGAGPFKPKGAGITFGADRRAKGNYKDVPGFYNVVCPHCQGELNLKGDCVLCGKHSPDFKSAPFFTKRILLHESYLLL